MIERKVERFLNYDTKENEIDDMETSKLVRYQINSYSVDRSIETLIKWKENGKLIVPDFQREYVWSYANSSRFIDSILLSLPIPNIFVFKVLRDNVEKYLLVDGMQRITTMQQYRNGIWKQNGKERNFKINIKSSNWYGKKYEDLNEDDKQFFLDYPISMMIFETSNISEANINNSIFSVFERINTGSEKLSDQEIRNAVYGGTCLDSIKQACKNKCYKDLISHDSKRLLKRDKYIELFIRFLTYNRIYSQQIKGINEMVLGIEESKINNSKKVSLNNYLNYSNAGKIDLNQDIAKVIKACEIVSNFDNTLFYNVMRNDSKIGNRVHEIFAEALIIAVINNNFIIESNKKTMWNKKTELWRSDLFYNLFVENTTDPTSVVKRVDYLLNIIKGN